MMKSCTVILILILPFLFIACNKKDYSENDTIYGQWVEETELTDCEELLFQDNDTLIYGTRSASRYIYSEKFAYSLNNRRTKLYLWPEDGSDYKTCKIELKNGGMEMTITGLNSSNSTQKFARMSQ